VFISAQRGANLPVTRGPYHQGMNLRQALDAVGFLAYLLAVGGSPADWRAAMAARVAEGASSQELRSRAADARPAARVA
jgi:hypothetical protein